MSRIGRQPGAGGRRAIFNQQQEQEICNIVVANNSITLREIRTTILEDNAGIFQNVNAVSISTIDRVLIKNQMSMKQLYRVPFERNSERTKELRYQYVQVKQWCALRLVYCTVLCVVYHYDLLAVEHRAQFIELAENTEHFHVICCMILLHNQFTVIFSLLYCRE